MVLLRATDLARAAISSWRPASGGLQSGSRSRPSASSRRRLTGRCDSCNLAAPRRSAWRKNRSNCARPMAITNLANPAARTPFGKDRRFVYRGSASRLGQSQRRSQTSNKAERASKQAQKQADDQPADDHRHQEAERKRQQFAEAKQRADHAQTQYNDAQAKSDVARSKAESARNLHDRARNAKKNPEVAQKILEGAQLRVADTLRRLNCPE